MFLSKGIIIETINVIFLYTPCYVFSNFANNKNLWYYTFMRLIQLFIALSLLVSCSFNKDKELEKALLLAGNNRAELEKVLEHYQNDSLKLKAARFLITNMPGHGTYVGKNVDVFYKALDSILPYERDVDHINLLQDKINQLVKDINPYEKMQWREDIHSIKADFLRNNIDHAFKAWQEEPFARHINFEDFCEYLLPYRVENEPLEYWRDSIYPHYNKIKYLGYYDGSEYSTYWACCSLNDSVKNGSPIRLEQDNWRVTRKYSIMKRMTYGKCEDYAVLATYVMRAKGIPVMIDYTPQWPYRSLGHSWNIVKVNDGRNVKFGGADTNPGERHKAAVKMAKVYRKTYAINKKSLVYRCGNEEIPEQFSSPFMKDVTHEYFEGTNIQIPLEYEPSQARKFVYLCVFDNKEWIPVSFSEKKNGKATFTHVGKDILYLVASYVNHTMEPATSPFIIDLKGDIHFCKPDKERVQTRRLERKYPINETMFVVNERMVGGKIQGSNHPEFQNAHTFHTIPVNSMGKRIFVSINPQGQKYRYWRYLAPPKAYGNIAELEFYRNDTLYNAHGTIIGTPGSQRDNPDYVKEKALDGDPLTFFDAHDEDGGWVGMDFNHPVSFNKIAYTPRNDGNYVYPGDKYELLYYGEKGWVSLGEKIATNDYIEYDSIPNNALLWLRDLTKGAEERIFTFEEDKVYWW